MAGDCDSWQALIALTQVLGMDELTQEFQVALATEERHMATVRSWVRQSTEQLAQG